LASVISKIGKDEYLRRLAGALGECDDFYFRVSLIIDLSEIGEIVPVG